ncbi:MAG: DUF6132 family protein [Bacteroidales bacterium]
MENITTSDKNILRKKLFGKISVLVLIGTVIGAIGGYIYYIQVGCVSGTCAITSSPWMSTAWGGAFGYLIFDLFTKKESPKEN